MPLSNKDFTILAFLEISRWVLKGLGILAVCAAALLFICAVFYFIATHFFVLLALFMLLVVAGIVGHSWEK